MIKTYLIPTLIAFTALRASANYGASTDDYGPYRDNEKPAQTLVKPLDQLESTNTDTILTQKLGFKDDPQAPTWKVVTNSMDRKNSSILFQLVRNHIKKPLRFLVTGKILVNIMASDLNGDGLPDYLLTFWVPKQTTEDGEESERPDMNPKNDSFIVLLSVKKTYRAYWVENAYVPNWGIYRLRSPAQTVLLASCDFPGTHLSLPPETRVIFHLYQLIAVKGSRIALENDLDRRFPMFVAQDESSTHKNHKETKLLSDDRKKESLKLYKPVITEIHFKR